MESVSFLVTFRRNKFPETIHLIVKTSARNSLGQNLIIVSDSVSQKIGKYLSSRREDQNFEFY